MKTRILILALFGCLSVGLYAQQTLQVTPGTANRLFTAQNPLGTSTFNWSISGTAHTTTPAGNASTTTISFGNTIGSSSILSLTPVSANGCLGVTRTLTIDVIAEADLSYTAAISSPLPVCGGGTFSATITIGGTGSTSGLNAGNPVYIYYSVDNTPASAPVTLSTVSQSVSFPGALTAGTTYNYKITGVRFGNITSDSDVSQSVTVDAVPSVDGIQ